MSLSSRRRAVVALALGAVALGVVVMATAPGLAEGFGASHDGYNGATWGLSARGLLDDPLGSRLGGVQGDGTRYANHPPLIIWISAVSSGLTDGAPLGLRIPAAICTAAAMAIVAALLLDAGVRPLAASAGVAVALSTAMVTTYGAMLDTPVVSLPFGLAAVWAVQRGGQGRPLAPGWVAVIGALAALAGWQSALLAALSVAAAAITPGRRLRGVAVVLGAGAAAGTAVTLAWIVWVRGSLAKLGDQARLRSGGEVGRSWWSAQADHLGDLIGPAALVAIALGAVAAVSLARRARRDEMSGDGVPSDERPRAELTSHDEEGGEGPVRGAARSLWSTPAPALALTAVATLVYSVVFRQASAVHDYWAYWALAPLALAVGAGAEVALRAADRRGRLGGAALTGAAIGVVLAIVGLSLGRGDGARAEAVDGLDVIPVLAAATAEGDDPPPLAVRGATSGAPWARWAIKGPVVVPDPHELATLPDDHLVLIETSGPPSAAVRAVALARQGRFVLLRAGDYRASRGR